MKRPDTGTVVVFILTGIVWGAGFLFIRLAVAGMTPVQFVWLRTVLATTVLAAAMVAMRRRWPRGIVAWRRIATLGIVGVAIPFLFYAWAGQRIPSGLSSIYNAAVPVATALVTIVATRQERLGARKLLAIGLGAGGILIVMAPWQLDSSAFDLWGQLACIAAVLGLGFAFAYTRKAISPLGIDPIGVAAGQMLVCAVAFTLVMPFTAQPPIRWDAGVVTALVLSGIFATGVAYIWNFRIIDRWGAASASMVTYLTTLVGVALGIVVLHEPISLNQVLGAVVVLVGVAVGVSRPRGPRPL